MGIEIPRFAPEISQDFIRFDEGTRAFLNSLGGDTAGMATSGSWHCPVCNYPGNAHSAKCFVAKLVLEIGKAGTVRLWVDAVEQEMTKPDGPAPSMSCQDILERAESAEAEADRLKAALRDANGHVYWVMLNPGPGNGNSIRRAYDIITAALAPSDRNTT